MDPELSELDEDDSVDAIIIPPLPDEEVPDVSDEELNRVAIDTPLDPDLESESAPE